MREKVTLWSDYIDYWSVDFDFRDDTFHNEWQAYRTREEPKLAIDSDWHDYEIEPGRYSIVVKVIDIFGNDTTKLAEVIDQMSKDGFSEKIERTGDALCRSPSVRTPSKQTASGERHSPEVDAWRANGYLGASETTKRLFRVLVRGRPPDCKWAFRSSTTSASVRPWRRSSFCMRCAGCEVSWDLMPFCGRTGGVRPRGAERARYVFKMATGSGKTKAMALCVAWSYFHSLYEPDSPMTPHCAADRAERDRLRAAERRLR